MTVQSKKSLVILTGLIGFIVLLTCFGLKNPRESFQEMCVRKCQPRQGIVERDGPVLGPNWRPSQRNVVCVCK
jgi:hypothetical protein